MEAVVRTARTVEEAEELALKELGAERNEVEVEILSRGKAGFLGIGAEVARVRVTRIPPGGIAPSEPAEPAEPAEPTEAVGTVQESPPAAVAEPVGSDSGSDGIGNEGKSDGTASGVAIEALNNILAKAGVNVASTIRTTNDPDVGGPIIDLNGEDSGLLIGRRGQTLQSLQFIVNLIVRSELGEGTRVVLDVERYRQRREASLRDMAVKVAERVTQTGRSITLEPMSAADRRIIHLSLSESPSVTTESVSPPRAWGSETTAKSAFSRRGSFSPTFL